MAEKITVGFVEKIYEFKNKKGNVQKKMRYLYISGDDDGGKLSKKSSSKFFIATGSDLGELYHSKYHLEGYWSCSGGIRQFTVTGCVEDVPNNCLAVTEYLESLTHKILAKKIYDALGDEALIKLDENLHLIDDIINLKPQRIAFKRAYVKRRFGARLIQELAEYDVSFDKCVEIANAIPNAYQTIRTNPYILYTDFHVPFNKADAYASKLGFSPDNKKRMEAAVLYACQNAEMNDGSCGCSIEECYKFTKRITKQDISKKQFSELFNANASEKRVVCVENLVYRYSTYVEESIVANRIYELNQDKVFKISKLEEKISIWEKAKAKELGFDFSLHLLQKEAIMKSLDSGFSIITGGPGCGKTTIIEAIVSIWQTYGKNPSVCQVCPTGKAAQRMTEATGLPASTIHSRLEIFDSEDYDGTEKLITDGLVICDEGSMLDIHVAANLLRHIKNGSKVIFVGDIHQLPSVGCGAVLRDIIASGVVPVTMLEKPFRQKEGSSIIQMALNINEGTSILDVFNGKDSFFMRPTSLRQMTQQAVRLYERKVEQFGIDNVCMLTPLHHHKKDIKGHCPCSDDLNFFAQMIINPPSDEKDELVVIQKRRTGFTPDKKRLSTEAFDTPVTYRVGDLVMNTRNGVGITNGDIGKIIGIIKNEGENSLVVEFPQGERVITGKAIGDLELAYSMSIHKSQGSEYQCVIICLPDEAKQMLQRNLFYTGVTRAKQEVVVISSTDAIDYAIAHEDVSNRRTLLKEKLIKLFGVSKEEMLEAK